MELKRGVARRIPVRLTAIVDGAPWTLIPYNEITVTVQKEGGAPYPKTISSGDWSESDAVNMPGQYGLLLSTSDTDTPGFLMVTVDHDLVQPYPGLFEVVTNTNDDLASALQATQTALAGNISTSEQNVLTQVSAVQSALASQGQQAEVMTQALTRLLGLGMENVVQDEQVYDADGNLTSARMRAFNTAAEALAASSGNADTPRDTYDIEARFDSTAHMTFFRMTRRVA